MGRDIKSFERPNDALIIAHLSDLHIGLKQADDRLEELYKAITVVKPDLIVLTGDIADSPTTENAKLAKKVVGRLEDMCAKGVFLIYGNHDRFPKGNRLTRWFHGSARIADTLTNHPATPREEINIKGIHLGLLGIDSATDGRYFAQGYIEPDQLARFERDAADLAKSCDVLIACLHHHPIKIAEVEKGALHEASRSLVNSAQLLRVLCRARVDILLHGHHHHKRLCWYGESDYEDGYHFPMLVLGAGSAVGASGLACQEEQASFNTLFVTQSKKYDVGFFWWNKTSVCWEYDLLCAKSGDEEFEQLYAAFEPAFRDVGVYQHWTPPSDSKNDVSKEHLIRFGFQMLLNLSLHICPTAYSANLWVSHSCDKDAKPTFLRSDEREGRFPFDQLVNIDATGVHYRPHAISYNKKSIQDLSVAARSVVEHQIVLINPITTKYPSTVEKKLGTNYIVGIPVHSNDHCRASAGAPLTITIDLRFDKEPSADVQATLRERARKVQELFVKLSDFCMTTQSHQKDDGDQKN